MLLQFYEELRAVVGDNNAAKAWLQQDGARAHVFHISMLSLQDLFRSNIVSQNSNISWSAKSPDLSICNFFYGAASRNPFMLMETLLSIDQLKNYYYKFQRFQTFTCISAYS